MNKNIQKFNISAGLILFVLIIVNLFYFWYRGDTPKEAVKIAVRESISLKLEKNIGDNGRVYTILAKNRSDLYQAMAFAQASEELFHFEIRRLILQGRMSDYFGEKWLYSDRLMQVLDFKEKAEQLLEKTDSLIVEQFHSYVAGLNTYQEKCNLPDTYKLYSIIPDKWEVADILAMEELDKFLQSDCWKQRLIFEEIFRYYGSQMLTELLGKTVPFLYQVDKLPIDYLVIVKIIDDVQKLQQDVIKNKNISFLTSFHKQNTNYQINAQLDSVFYTFTRQGRETSMLFDECRKNDKCLKWSDKNSGYLLFFNEKLSENGLKYFEQGDWISLKYYDKNGWKFRKTHRGIVLNDFAEEYKYWQRAMSFNWQDQGIMDTMLVSLKAQILFCVSDGYYHKNRMLNFFSNSVENFSLMESDSILNHFFDREFSSKDIFRHVNRSDMKKMLLSENEKAIMIRVLFPEGEREEEFSQKMLKIYLKILSENVFSDEINPISPYISNLFFQDEELMSQCLNSLMGNPYLKWWDNIDTDSIETREEVLLNSFREMLEYLSINYGSEWEEWGK